MAFTAEAEFEGRGVRNTATSWDLLDIIDPTEVV
jgi:hypothetical protein